jgi:hypothetical protein
LVIGHRLPFDAICSTTGVEASDDIFRLSWVREERDSWLTSVYTATATVVPSSFNGQLIIMSRPSTFRVLASVGTRFEFLPVRIEKGQPGIINFKQDSFHERPSFNEQQIYRSRRTQDSIMACRPLLVERSTPGITVLTATRGFDRRVPLTEAFSQA